jgi:5,10-methylenetetrahydromethanopterin reductase
MSNGKLPQIGIRLSGAIDPRRCIELARSAEAAGLASVWFAENPIQRGVFATAGACAAATERIRIGIGVINPYSRHPSLIAMEAAALDELAGGRALLGVGSGIGGAVRSMGFSYDRPVTAVREAVAIMRAMLSGDSVTYHGRVFSTDGAWLGLRPHRSDMPIYTAASGEPALRACGEIADGLIVSNLTPARSTERMAVIVAEAAAKVGRAMPRVVQYVPCILAADGAAARDSAKPILGDMLTAFWPANDDWPKSKETTVLESGIARREFMTALARLRRGENAASVLDDRFVAAFAIAGTADECLRQAVRYRYAGADELALTFVAAQTAESIAYFGRLSA